MIIDLVVILWSPWETHITNLDDCYFQTASSGLPVLGGGGVDWPINIRHVTHPFILMIHFLLIQKHEKSIMAI